MVTTIVLYIGYQAVAPLVAIGFFVVFLGSLLPTGVADPSTVFSFLAGILAFLGLVCALLVFLLVVLIFGLLGYQSMHEGRYEFGPAHATEMSRAFTYFLVAVVVAIAGGAIVGAFSAGAGILTLGTPGLPTSPWIGAASAAVGGVGASLWGMFFLLLIRTFVTPPRLQLARYAISVGVAGPLVSGAIVTLGSAVVGPFTDPARLVPLIPWFIAAGVAGWALGLASAVLFYLVYKEAKDRLERGEIRAVPPPVPPYPYPAPGFGYPWTYGPPPGPPPQPPSGPSP